MAGLAMTTILAGRDDGAVDAVDCGSGSPDHAVIVSATAANCESLVTVP
jgi:hypothetical protein